jgi:hypothetical protein
MIKDAITFAMKMEVCKFVEGASPSPYDRPAPEVEDSLVFDENGEPIEP